MNQQTADIPRKSKFKSNSIQSKLTLAFVLLLIPVVALISIFSFRNAQSLLTQRTFEQLEYIVNAKQRELKKIIQRNLNQTQTIATQAELIEKIQDINKTRDKNSTKLGDYLKNLLIYYPSFTDIYVTGIDGELLASASAEPSTLSEINFIDSAALKSDFSIYEKEGKVLLKGPIYAGKEVIAILNVISNLDEINEVMKQHSGLGQSGEVLIGKLAGTEIIFITQRRSLQDQDHHRISVKENRQSPTVLATQKLSGIAVSKDYRGVEVLAAYQPLPISGWGLVAKIDTAEAFEHIVSFRNELVGISLLTLLLFILVAFLISRSIVQPLYKLHIGTEKIAKGDWDYKLNISTGDEVEELAHEFSNMAQELKSSYTGLERTVQERTAELQKEKEISESLSEDLKKFQLAVENASDQIVITDPEANIIYANQALKSTTGFTKEEVIGKNPGKLWGGIMKQPFYNKMWKTIKQDKKTYESDIRNKKKNGKEYYAAIGITPILDEAENIKFFVGIERDVTRAKEIDRMKTEFISVASHQLRTPLSAIKWFTEMLLSGDAGKPTKEQNEFLQQIYDSNERMIDLVNALLNVSRIEQGRIAIEPKPTNLSQLVDDVIAELTPKIKEKNLRVTISKHQKLPKISVDPKLIRQVYANLISNSVKYTQDKGEITIFISRKGKDIVSQISDTGFGIPKHQQDKIFTKFFRADNIRKISTDGTGLGVYIVKSIVESSAGKIWFQSEEGKGTTFWFTLPVKGTEAQKGDRSLEDIKL